MAANNLSMLLSFFKPRIFLRQCCASHMVFKPLTVYGLGRQISVTAIHLDRKSPTDSAANAATDKNAQHVIRFGKVYDKKPVRMALEDGKLYSWCTCGLSKKQPFCDNSHRAFNEENSDKSLPPFKSHKFQVDKKKEYALCNCKQTKNRPFCDGTHKQPSIQDAVLSH